MLPHIGLEKGIFQHHRCHSVVMTTINQMSWAFRKVFTNIFWEAWVRNIHHKDNQGSVLRLAVIERVCSRRSGNKKSRPRICLWPVICRRDLNIHVRSGVVLLKCLSISRNLNVKNPYLILFACYLSKNSMILIPYLQVLIMVFKN